MKDYDPEKGIPLDGSFSDHSKRCSRCASSSMSEWCLEGSVLWKHENTVKSERVIQDDPNRTTIKHAKELMRYK